MIKLIIIGGTIDKDYSPITGTLVFYKTYINEMLQQANCQLDIKSEVLMLKDSLDMSDKDRQSIAQTCIGTTEDKIIITHGTDTMVITALLLSKLTELSKKTIILTGAIRPFKLGNSDALFNLGSAICACDILEGGVKIAMNGKLFNADEVVKDIKQGVFINK